MNYGARISLWRACLSATVQRKKCNKWSGIGVPVELEFHLAELYLCTL